MIRNGSGRSALPARADVFRAALFGSSGQIVLAVLPALIASFSPSMLRCLVPARAKYLRSGPTSGCDSFFCNCQSKAFITRRSVPVSVSLLRKCRIVFSSGVGPPRSKRRKRVQDSQPRIMNSIFASLRFCCACRISAWNIETGPEGRAPALGSVAVAEALDQPAAEILKVDGGLRNLERNADLAQSLTMVPDPKKRPPFSEPARRPRR